VQVDTGLCDDGRISDSSMQSVNRASTRFTPLKALASVDGDIDADVEEVPLNLDGRGGGALPVGKGGWEEPAMFEMLMEEVRTAAQVFWLRRSIRRRLLKRLAEDCARFGREVRRRGAELRASAARRRLEMLRAGDSDSYAASVGACNEGRLRTILDETERILKELASPLSLDVVEVEQPSILKGVTLMPHQIHGLRWLVSLTENQMSGILADDMGLGKTVQTLAFLAHLAEHRAEPGPHLILLPFSTLSHWVDEITSWLPSLHFIVFRGQERDIFALRQEMVRGVNSVNIVLSTFETFVVHHAFLTSFPWFCVIADEGHRLKNFNTRVSRLCRMLPCRHRFLLTGTPVQNSLGELWSLLSFVAPQAFGSLDEFHMWFALPPPPSLRDIDDVDAVSKMLSEEEELLIIQRLHSVLRPFLLRRTKDLVLADLPEKNEVVIWVPMSSWQKALYASSVRRLKCLGAGKGGAMPSSCSVMGLRKALNHPFHFIDGQSTVAEKEENLYRASGKFEFLDRVLPRMLQFGHKILIFAQMTSLLDLLQQLLLRHGIRYQRIDGSMSMRRRRDALHSFRTEPETGVLLLTTRAGGLGLNLQVADTVILFDSDWNPQVDAQAMDRVHRIGQQRPVLVVRLMTPTALDRGMLARLDGKLGIEKKVISAGNFHHEQDQDGSCSSLLQQLVREARQASPDGAAEATPLAEVSRLLARSPEERVAFDAADEALLGPPAASDTGAAEAAAERLERCGRLLASGELGAIPLKARAVPPNKRASRKVPDP